MSKFHFFKIIVVCVLISWLFNIFLGRFLIAKISTWPLLNHWHILSPDAPIVITNREVVRVEGSGDVVQTATALKSKISAILLVAESGVTLAGGAINLTSDGNFVTGAPWLAKNPGNYQVLLSDGRSAKITAWVLDPATSLVFFKADLGNVPVANLASSKDLNVGEKILFVSNSMQNFMDKASVSFVNFSQKDIAGQIMESDFPKRAFGAQPFQPLLSGQILVNVNADIVGIYDGSTVISSDVLRQAMNLYFGNGQKINRPSFGFSYAIVTENASRLRNLPEGAEVKLVAKSSPAQTAGLLENDIIIDVDGNKINENSPLEEILQKYKTGDTINLTIARDKANINLTLKAGELK